MHHYGREHMIHGDFSSHMMIMQARLFFAALLLRWQAGKGAGGVRGGPRHNTCMHAWDSRGARMVGRDTDRYVTECSDEEN
jgi:hypothetical protein